MKNSKKDAQYSVSAKICLAEALITLMEQVPLDSIKIQDLAKKAGVSRMSYYRNFSSKVEILEFYIEHILNAYQQPLKELPIKDFHTYERILDCIKYFYQYKNFICCLKKSGFCLLFLEKLNTFMEKHTTFSNSKHNYSLYYYIGAVFNIYIQWISRDTPESPEEIASFIFHLI